MNQAFVISHLFNAPRDLVWAVYTQPQHLQNWLGPQGSTMPHSSMDFKEGGSFHYCLRMPNGADLWGKWLIQEIAAPEKIVVIQHFSNPEGQLTRHPMAPTWPRQTLGTTTLESRGDTTQLTLEWSPYDSTPEQIATFNASHSFMTTGWTLNFTLLEQYLAQVQAQSAEDTAAGS
jgi:uncharacterized protein YndB with AHSA1/START domain